jgi:hypothetical protein
MRPEKRPEICHAIFPSLPDPDGLKLARAAFAAAVHRCRDERGE